MQRREQQREQQREVWREEWREQREEAYRNRWMEDEIERLGEHIDEKMCMLKQKKKPEYRIQVIGTGGVGKTCLIIAVRDTNAIEKCVNMLKEKRAGLAVEIREVTDRLQEEMLRKRLKGFLAMAGIVSLASVSAHIWDTAGQERFESIRTQEILIPPEDHQRDVDYEYDLGKKQCVRRIKLMSQGRFAMHRHKPPKKPVPRQRRQFIPGRTLKYVI